jgi:hypothetical protein
VNATTSTPTATSTPRANALTWPPARPCLPGTAFGGVLLTLPQSTAGGDTVESNFTAEMGLAVQLLLQVCFPTTTLDLYAVFSRVHSWPTFSLMCTRKTRSKRNQ